VGLSESFPDQEGIKTKNVKNPAPSPLSESFPDQEGIKNDLCNAGHLMITNLSIFLFF